MVSRASPSRRPKQWLEAAAAFRMMNTARRPFAVLALVGGCVFVSLLVQLLLQAPLVTWLDPTLSQWWAAHRAPGLTALLMAITEWHSTLGIDLMLAAAALVLAWRARWRDAVWLVVAVQSAMVLNVLLKHAFARARPVLDLPLVRLETFSFPSGHALASTAFWGCVVLLVPRAMRWPASIAAALLVLLVAFSRVYLGAHYLSDVLAGISEGLVCVAGFAVLHERLSLRP
jgi:membrane-associated phospholipid phosphatase